MPLPLLLLLLLMGQVITLLTCIGEVLASNPG
jgi:hypothetical protein